MLQAVAIPTFPKFIHQRTYRQVYFCGDFVAFQVGRLSAFGRIGIAVFRSTMTVKNGNCIGEYDCSIIFPGIYHMNKTGFSPYLGAGMEYRGWVAEVIAAPGISATLDSIQRGTVAYYIGYAWKI